LGALISASDVIAFCARSSWMKPMVPLSRTAAKMTAESM
jgi:hypothetical protein